MYEVMHVGVPVKEPKEGEQYVEGLKLHLVGPESNKFGFEYLRFDEDTPMHKDIVENVHIAYKVDSLDEFLKDSEVLQQPMQVDESLTIAFVKIDGAVLELMEFKK